MPSASSGPASRRVGPTSAMLPLGVPRRRPPRRDLLESRAPMQSPRANLKTLLAAAFTMAALFVLQAAAWAQQESPIGPLPGQPLEHPETPLWLTLTAIAVALGALGLVVLIGASYLFLSRRFFSKEEPPPPRRPAIPIPPRPGVPPPARAGGQPGSETTPQGAGATGPEVAPAAPGRRPRSDRRRRKPRLPKRKRR